MGALSLTASKPQQRRRFAPLVPGVTHVRYPDVYRGCVGEADQEADAYALGCARFIEEKLFKTTLPPEEVAAIFVEPIQGEGGYVVAPTVFMQELRRICDRHGILLVADEVQSGAAAPANGGPSSTPASSPTSSAWPKASPAACRWASCMSGRDHGLGARLARLHLRRQSGLHCGRAGHHGRHRARGHRQRRSGRPSHDGTHCRVAAELDLVGDVRGRGLMIGVEIVTDKKAKTPGGAERDRIVELAFERGLLLLGCGPNTIRICPPLIVTKARQFAPPDFLFSRLGYIGCFPHS
jgi:4-aminobutyrate aminotransferase